MKRLIKKLAGRPALRAYHAAKSTLFSTLAGQPGADFVTIGVTGTNGKTTTANLITHIFEASGHKVALLSTIQFRINGEETINELKMTVPDPRTFNRFLTKAKQAGCTVLVVEATSHALDQNRFSGLTFDTGVLTNITHDHLDYHGTFDGYVQAKRTLFARGLRLSVLNADDPNGLEFSKLPAGIHTLYTLDPTALGMLRPVRVVQHGEHTEIELTLPDQELSFTVKTTLPGQFNVQNILAAVGVALGHGIDVRHIQEGIEAVRAVPGRMEQVNVGQPFTVIIDYAHTPDALEQMFAALKPLKKGRVISVLGATGERDTAKRPVLGKIAATHADIVMVTNEDPYEEDPRAIIDAVASGVPEVDSHHEGQTWWRVDDRAEAIEKALDMAHSGDIVTVTGKGAETGMAVKGGTVPWSDRAIIEKALKRLGY